MIDDTPESEPRKSTQPLSQKRMGEIRANLTWTIEECGMYSPPYAEMYMRDVASLIKEVERLQAHDSGPDSGHDASHDAPPDGG